MNLREFIADSKTVTDQGVWMQKKMPKTGGKFPLTKNRSYRLSNAWRWRVVELSASTTDYRLLIAYNPDKEQYVAALGVASASDTLILGRLEYHATHRGWHVHGCCVETDARHWGRIDHPELKRIPGGEKLHRRKVFGINDSTALEVAADFFKIQGLDAPPELPQQHCLWQ